MPNRRTVLAGLAGLALSNAAMAEDASPVAHGVLKDNKLAQAFEAAPRDTLPDIMVTGRNGDQKIADLLKGRIVLMPIWAEWCVPCLMELPDFARLQEVYGKGRFAIIPILSSPKHQMTPDTTASLLAQLHADIFEPLIEQGLGARLAITMARRGNGYGLPCNLLIGADGRVIGREIGIKSNHPDDANKDTSVAAAFARVDRAANGDTQSLWGTPAGDEFATVMSAGFFG